jgi:O-antigen ligase
VRAWALQRFQTYGRVLLATAVFLTPVIFYRGAADVFDLPKLTILWVLGVIALALWVIWSAERRVWPPRFRLAYATAAFLAAFALATVFSRSPLLSLIGIHERYGGLIPLLLYAVIMVLIAGFYWETPGDLKDVARAVAAGAAVLAAYILIQKAGLDWIPWATRGGGRPSFFSGSMGNSNYAGAFLGLSIPFVAYAFVAAATTVARVALAAVAGVSLLALWYTQTRGGLLAAAVALIVMAFTNRNRLRLWLKMVVVLGIVAVLGALAVFVFWRPESGRLPAPLAKVVLFRSQTVNFRFYYWGAAGNAFLHHPILGTGPETFYASYPRYRPAKDAGNQAGFVDKPHSIYFEYAANTGALGLGAYLALVGLAGWYGYRRARRLEGPERLLLTAFLGSLAGYLAQGAVSIDVPPLAAMGWVALGGIAAIADPKIVQARQRLAAAEQQKRKPGAKKSKRTSTATDPTQYSGSSRWPVHVAAGVGAVVLITLGVRPLLADVEAQTAQNKQAQNAPVSEVNSHFERAIKLYPFESSYRNLAGAFATAQAQAASDSDKKKLLLIEALAHYRDADRLMPEALDYEAGIAGTYVTLGQIDPKHFAEADRVWTEIVSFDPVDWEAHYRYASMLNSWAHAAEDPAIRLRAANQLEKVTRIRPDYVQAWIQLGKIYLILNESDKADPALRQALALQPDNHEIQKLLEANGRAS